AAALRAFTFSVALVPAVTDVGVTEALAPLGVPDTLRLIVPPLPTTVVEMVLQPLAPCTRLTQLGPPAVVKTSLAADAGQRSGRRAAWKLERGDTSIPVECAITGKVFVRVPESAIVAWVDGHRTVIAPA